MKSILSLSLMIVLFGTRFAGAISITGSASAPTTDIVESMGDTSNPTASTFNWVGTGNEQHIASGQTFKHASAFTADKITVLMSPSANAATFNSNLSMHIRLYTYGGATDPPAALPGTPLLEEAGTLPTNFVNNTYQYVTFDITNTPLNANQDYIFVVDFTTAIAPGSGSNAAYTGTLYGNSSGGSYPTGLHRIWIEHSTGHSGGADWDAGDGGTDDIIFYIQSPAVPEPSSFVLAGLGIVGLVGYVARRNRSQA